ncbi:uncharacterized protein EI90DRAFT_3127680 [Cantharellus anzutake]|uniref:uncharacterized protein n=1 Tax=Cantharellus anzutake TaxID=1750568 RepID=UPI001908AF62|nr:uncharacterized protein EI90DRAFT_3127680 [Cantharellus anzutake]KAF8326876.1 hypothetical protein EI90DRAFT_3127680 [Cantharellus anzutake]
MEVPNDPADNGYFQPNPYTDITERILENLKAEFDSTEGWQLIGTKNGAVMEKKTAIDGSAIPVVRGKGTIEGVKPYQFYSIVTHTGARQHWDPRFEAGYALKRYSRRAYKFYTIQKGSFLVQPRDFVGVSDTIFEEDGSIYVAQGSVPDDGETGPVEGRTRGTLHLAGWSIKPKGDGSEITYIVHVNPNGSIPTAIVASVVQDTPLSVPNAIDWCQKEGIIPHIEQLDIKSTVRIESYSHEDAKKYRLALLGKAGDEFDILVDEEKKYPDGYNVEKIGEGIDYVQLTTSKGKVHAKIGEGADGRKFEIIITTK